MYYARFDRLQNKLGKWDDLYDTACGPIKVKKLINVYMNRPKKFRGALMLLSEDPFTEWPM